MDTGVTWFRSQVLAEEAAAIGSDASQHAASAHASVTRTSLRRGENKVAWISGAEEPNESHHSSKPPLAKIRSRKSSSDNT